MKTYGSALCRTAWLAGFHYTMMYLAVTVMVLALPFEVVRSVRLSHGADAVGVVTATRDWTETGRWGREHRVLAVDYVFTTASGETVEGSTRVGIAVWDVARRDGTVRVRYVVDQPRIHAVELWNPVGLALLVLVALATAIPANLRAARLFRFALETERLLERPVWRAAQVTRHVRVEGLNTHWYLEWRDEAGEVGRNMLPLKAWGAPEPGATIRVLVDPFGRRHRWEAET